MRAKRAGAMAVGAAAALLLGGAALSAEQRGSLSFAQAASYPTATGRLDGFVVTDLNGDGKPDVATADSYRGLAHVLLDRRDGTLESHVDYPIRRTGDGMAFAVGDLTGDGRPELVVDSRHNVATLVNRGNGTFLPRVDTPTRVVPGPVALADVNGDGRTDVLAVGDARLAVLLGNGDGTFAAEEDYPLVSAAHNIAVGTLNGDSAPDLVIGNGYPDAAPDSVSVLLNRGDGSFLARRDYVVPGAPDAVTLADLNADGKADVVAGGEDDNAIWVFLNHGDGTLGAHQTYRVPGEIVAAIATGRLDANRSLDVVVAPEAHHADVSVFLNRGDGTFRARRDYAVRETPEDLSLLDLNGDGRLDIVSADRAWDPRFDPDQETLSVLLNRGRGTFGARRDYLVGRSDSPTRFGDLNGDGRLDLVTERIDGNGVSVRLSRPGLCNVQDVVGQTLRAAGRTLARVGCREGSVRYAHSMRVRAGGVISESPHFGAVRGRGATVDLTVSLGRS